MWNVTQSLEFGEWFKDGSLVDAAAREDIYVAIRVQSCQRILRPQGQARKVENGMAQRKNKNTKKLPNFFKEASKVMSPESTKRAEERARLAVLNYELAKMREGLGIRQTEVKGFSQPGISKIESGQDMKISTVIEYLRGIGFGLEINAIPLESTGKKKTLLKAS